MQKSREPSSLQAPTLAWLVFAAAACGTTGSAPDAAPGDARISDVSADTSTDAGVTLGAPRVYVGSGDGNIRVYAFDVASYALTPVDVTVAGGNPSFLAFDPTMSFVYAVDEINSVLRAFAIDKASGKLSFVGAVSSLGNDPAHVSLDRSGAFVMVANYGSGTVAVFPRSDGRLQDAAATYAFGATAMSHEIVADPSNAFVLVPNKGLDAVGVFRRDGGALGFLGLTPAGGGARHIAFDPPGTHAYVIDETASTISAFAFDTQSGALTPTQTVSSLLDASVTANTGAEIQVTGDGQHVLASNRGDDSLVVFDVTSSGTLVPKARVPTGGKTPRQFQIDQTGRFLFVGNQLSGTVVVMKMDAQSGVPAPVGTPLAVPSPGFVGLEYLPP